MKRTIHTSPKQAAGRIPRDLKPRLTVDYQNHIDGPDDEEAAGDDDCWPAEDDEEGDPFPPYDGPKECAGRVGSMRNPTPEQKAALRARLERTRVEMTAKKKAREEEQARQRAEQHDSDVRNVRPPKSMARPQPGQTSLPPVPPDAPKKARPPLPPALQPGGLADQIIKSVRKAARRHHDLHMWTQKLTRDLHRMRREWEERKPINKKRAGTADDRYRAILNGGLEREIEESVALFRFCLAARENIVASDYLYKPARELCLAQPVGCHAAFSEFLPAMLREQIGKGLARLAYEQNKNATASADWSVFKENLSAQRRQPMLGIPTGLKSFDDATGGLRGATLLAGETGVGKSLLALDLAVRVILTNPLVAVLLYTMELTKDDVYTRLLLTAAQRT